MNKARLTSLSVTGLVLILAASLFLWVGCSDNPTAPVVQPTADLLKLSPDNPANVVQVMDVQNRHTPDLMKIQGVVGTGTTVDKNGNLAVMVFTERPGVQGLPASVDRLPVVMEVSGKFEAFALSGRYRPVPIGVSVGNNNECAAGTIGCVVYKSGVKYLLSNNHVLARENQAANGEPIVQPGRYDNRRCANKVTTDKVAELSDFQTLKFDGSNNTIDAAIAKYTITDVVCSTPASYYGFPGSTAVAAYVNQPIKKVGRTSSQTTGTVTAINVTSNVGYMSGTAKFVGQIYTSNGFSKSGDSGSLVVTNDGNNNPVGLLFAGTKQGNSLLNPIDLVLSRFNATICSQ